MTIGQLITKLEELNLRKDFNQLQVYLETDESSPVPLTAINVRIGKDMKVILESGGDTE